MSFITIYFSCCQIVYEMAPQPRGRDTIYLFFCCTFGGRINDCYTCIVCCNYLSHQKHFSGPEYSVNLADEWKLVRSQKRSISAGLVRALRSPPINGGPGSWSVLVSLDIPSRGWSIDHRSDRNVLSASKSTYSRQIMYNFILVPACTNYLSI